MRLIGRIDESRGVEQDVDDIARYDAPQHKDDDRDPEQGQEHQCKAPHDISKHLITTPLNRRGAYTRARPPTLFVQPHVFVAIAVVGAVHHDGDALDIGLPARTLAAVEDDRPGDVFLKLLVDVPYQLLALGG